MNIVDNKPDKDSEEKSKSFHPKVLLIWLGVLAAIIGLAMMQSKEMTPSHSTINSVNDLINEAKEGRIEQAVIESTPKAVKNGTPFKEISKSCISCHIK